MFDWFTQFIDWLAQLVKDSFTALLDLLKDFIFWLLDGLLSALAGIIESIPAPTVFDGYSFSSLLSGLPPYAQFVISQTNIGGALAMIGVAFTFRLTRKALTLFQW